MMKHSLHSADHDDDEYRLAEYQLQQQQQPTREETTTTSLNQHWLLPIFYYCKTNRCLVASAVSAIFLLVAVTAILTGNPNYPHQQQCPSDVGRFVNYNGFYFGYSLYLHQWPNPDPKILIFGRNGRAEEEGNLNEETMSKGCGGGGWTHSFVLADGRTLSYQYVVPEEQKNGGTFYINGVEYDLKNNGSVFLVESLEDNVLTQVNGLDLSHLVIDSETLSIASVTEFCMANQQILDFFDSGINADDNNN